MKILCFGFGKDATAGLALDEALLASAMVGSVGLFAAVTVPWESILPNTSSAVLNQMEQIEDANQEFFTRYSRWPNEVTNGFANNNAAVLVTAQAMRFPFNNMNGYQPLLKDMPYDIQRTGVVLRHDFGEGGEIVQMPSDRRDYRMQVVLQRVPLDIIQKIDARVDGEHDLASGRIQSRVRENRIDLVYYANPVKVALR